MGKVVAYCPTCGSGLIDLTRPCGLCELDRREYAAWMLITAKRRARDKAFAARAEAIDTLRGMGYSREQVRLVKELATEGQSVDDVLQVLGEPDTEGVAA